MAATAQALLLILLIVPIPTRRGGVALSTAPDRGGASIRCMTYFKLYTDLTEEELAQGVAAAKAHGAASL